MASTVFTGVFFSALQLRSENLSGWWRAALQGEYWKTKARPGRGCWRRPTSTKRQQKIQSNIKLSMFLYVSLAFWSRILHWLSDYLVRFKIRFGLPATVPFVPSQIGLATRPLLLPIQGTRKGRCLGRLSGRQGAKGCLGAAGAKTMPGPTVTRQGIDVSLLRVCESTSFVLCRSQQFDLEIKDTSTSQFASFLHHFAWFCMRHPGCLVYQWKSP